MIRSWWKVVAESVEGTSHLRESLPCQDRCRALPTRPRSETVLIAACADGAGSGALSEFGAERAVGSFIEQVNQALEGGREVSTIDRDVVLGWFLRARSDVEREAAARGAPVRDLASTLLTAIVSETRSIYAQVGDGGIVVGSAAGYEPIFWPQQGEYANVTNFLTGPSIERDFEFAESAAVDEIALFTDGLQRLVLDFSRRAVHQPFFRSMFGGLRDAESPEELIAPLQRLLRSPQVTDRTDDDKTLVLAIRSRHVDLATE